MAIKSAPRDGLDNKTDVPRRQWVMPLAVVVCAGG